MSTEELINAAKTVVTVLIGGALGKYGDKVIDWMRHGRKDKADVGKTIAEKNRQETEMLLSVLEGTKKINDALMGYNDKIVTENHKLSDEKRMLGEKVFELNQVVNKCLQEKSETERKLIDEKQKTSPDNRRDDRNLNR